MGLTFRKEVKYAIVGRNICIIFLLPLEVLVTLANNRRIGDIWAKTSVVYRDRNADKMI